MEIRNIGVSANQNNTASKESGSINGQSMNVTRVTASNATLANLTKGSVFSGDIVDVRNSAIKILLNDNQSIQAKTTNNTTLNIGDRIQFEVKENTGAQILIKALNVNNRFSSPLVTALESANIPVNERNMQMINEMMHNEMSIDKASVYDMFRTASNYEAYDVADVVDMVNHDIPLSNENLEQFDKYKNYEHRISNEIDNMSREIKDTLSEGIEFGKASEVREFAKELISSMTKDLSVKDMKTGIDLIAKDTLTSEIVLNEMDQFANINGENKGFNLEYSLSHYDEIIDSLANEEILDENGEAITNSKEIDLKHLQNINEFKENVLNEIKKFFHESINSNSVNKELMTSIVDKLPKEELKNIIDSQQFERFIKKAFSKEFKLDISKIEEDSDSLKKELSKLYEKLESRTENLSNMLKNAGLNSEKFANEVDSLKQNLKFMNELNNMATYVQMPLVTSNGDKHGELYVFNKKRTRNIENDEITAFMHLDMETLGATDVFVKLHDNALTTNFTLSDDLSIKIVDEHLDELQARLEKAGFDVKITTELSNDIKTPFEKVLELDKPKISIKRYSFDVRA